MNEIKLLDCTLRDGGYCNDCNFGFENAKKIVRSLLEANIDIIECGFLTSNIEYDREHTRFTSLNQVAKLIPKDRGDKLFVVLADYGKINVEEIPYYDGTSVDGIRVAFHKKNQIGGLEDCRKLKELGYKVFIQPMVAVSYSDEEYLNLIRQVNEIEPYAFYIVDSFGMMKNKDLIRLFYMVEHNLKSTIRIGFHAHNNMQLAYSNAQSLVNVQTNRHLIVDVSVYGMGRGAGNLNTELFVEYVNENADGNYVLKPLLTIIDEILNGFYQLNPWGYSLPNYLSAAHNAHPNYATYLAEKNTLTVEDMNEIFAIMDADKRLFFDRDYIAEVYLKYMETGRLQEEHKEKLKASLEGKKVLLIAPGKSSMEEKEKINALAQREDIVSVSVNFDYSDTETKYIFLSNLRRFRELPIEKRCKCIVTSNIPANGIYIQTGYKDLLADNESVRDNAGLMAIKFFLNQGVREFYLAGFDGYAHDPEKNYRDSQMTFITRNAVLDAMNRGMEDSLQIFSKRAVISFLTDQKHIRISPTKKDFSSGTT